MFCTSCGREIENDSIFCNYCGNKVEKIDEEIKLEEDKTHEEIKLEEDKTHEEIKLEEDKTHEEIKLEDKLEKIEPEYNINTLKILLTLCTIGLIASMVNIFRFYMLGKDLNYIFGQVIFGSIFLATSVLLWKSKKIGGALLFSFILFKAITSIYYYFETLQGYLIKNLILDEVFYLAIISLLFLEWRNLR